MYLKAIFYISWVILIFRSLLQKKSWNFCQGTTWAILRPLTIKKLVHHFINCIGGTSSPSTWIVVVVWHHIVQFPPKIYENGLSLSHIVMYEKGGSTNRFFLKSLLQYWHLMMVALFYFRTSLEVKCEIYSCALEPHSTDSLGHQHCAKELSPEFAPYLKWSVKVKQRNLRPWSSMSKIHFLNWTF